ncbi:fimbrial protein [Pseudomonas gingeri]|uniref:fimbrial protein n=1 Tax=Pseudomonas gingeri TaxID=117681 RepID=UPI00159FAD9B|nr:fimbrial protein [Pseudomonas gingeri]NWA04317.1 type 1 fimbrial protein [Pseudomonas gingeri]NWA15108.1 type 1 fimbrial protein [Pseudomonas gingeri]NWA54549.1 type 1 fimbrial protein [Pseudomonas gingeri]NWA98306.1 type 1 fimbrial protein [Pseudomonas gingeri]NWB04180.1 type 1 fimbrial protein [Pseudomonas gingeri]
MKTYLIPLALTVVAIAQASATEVLNPGNLRIEGTVEGGTCNLIADDIERSIPLPPVRVGDFANAESAGHKPFELSARCDADINSVTFTFSGIPSPSDPARFLNTGDAGGLGLWLYSRLGGVQQTLRADGSDSTRTLSPSGGQAVLPLGAAYWKSGAVREGTLESQAIVEITYN